VIIPSRRHALPVAIAVAAAIGGAIVAMHYHRLGLTLSHYDARGHLVVARRVIDSITPGWQQIGGVWLPLPHLLNVLPAQIDFLYRTGASAVLISILAFATATGAIARIVLDVTQSTMAAIIACAAFALNPNLLYLQATPMTEPLFLALTLVAVAMLVRWTSFRGGGDHGRGHGLAAIDGQAHEIIVFGWPPAQLVGSAFALACLTRYEAWSITVAGLLVSVWVFHRRGDSLGTACERVSKVATFPALAIIVFLVLNRVVTGEWTAGSGFFVPENEALGRPVEALAEILWGARALTGPFTFFIGSIGLTALLIAAIARRERAGSLVALTLVASAALPWVAFVDGHPFRIRYLVTLLPAISVGVGAAVGLYKRSTVVTALVIGLALAYEIRPLDPAAPMVVEAQWDRPNGAVRKQVTECLRGAYSGEKIMASMGSLGHYMQEMSRDGFNVRDFLHEGNGDIWLAALDRPRPYAGWLLIEEKAEGGDMLAQRAQKSPAFLEGFDRVCEGAGLALYRRRPTTQGGFSAAAPRTHED
jgi:hypothetical protein